MMYYKLYETDPLEAKARNERLKRQSADRMKAVAAKKKAKKA